MDDSLLGFVSIQSKETSKTKKKMMMLNFLINQERSPFRVFLKLCTQKLLDQF